MQKMMRADQILDYIAELVATGCEVCAVGDYGYVIGDADLPEATYERIAPVLVRIGAAYGQRDHLLAEIVAYLRSIGRYIDLDDETP